MIHSLSLVPRLLLLLFFLQVKKAERQAWGRGYLSLTLCLMHCTYYASRQISKKHQIRLDTPWLDPGKTLAEQEVTENDELILMYRFYYHMELDRYAYHVYASLVPYNLLNLSCHNHMHCCYFTSGSLQILKCCTSKRGTFELR